MQALRPKMVLSRTVHRPYPVPAGPWVLFMSWHDLLFMHWPVHEEALRSLIPPALHLDTFDGSAWLSVTPFRMTGVRPRFLPYSMRGSRVPVSFWLVKAYLNSPIKPKAGQMLVVARKG